MKLLISIALVWFLTPLCASMQQLVLDNFSVIVSYQLNRLEDQYLLRLAKGEPAAKVFADLPRMPIWLEYIQDDILQGSDILKKILKAKGIATTPAHWEALVEGRPVGRAVLRAVSGDDFAAAYAGARDVRIMCDGADITPAVAERVAHDAGLTDATAERAARKAARELALVVAGWNGAIAPGVAAHMDNTTPGSAADFAARCEDATHAYVRANRAIFMPLHVRNLCAQTFATLTQSTLADGGCAPFAEKDAVSRMVVLSLVPGCLRPGYLERQVGAQLMAGASADADTPMSTRVREALVTALGMFQEDATTTAAIADLMGAGVPRIEATRRVRAEAGLPARRAMPAEWQDAGAYASVMPMDGRDLCTEAFLSLAQSSLARGHDSETATTEAVTRMVVRALVPVCYRADAFECQVGAQLIAGARAGVGAATSMSTQVREALVAALGMFHDDATTTAAIADLMGAGVSRIEATLQVRAQAQAQAGHLARGVLPDERGAAAAAAAAAAHGDDYDPTGGAGDAGVAHP